MTSHPQNTPLEGVATTGTASVTTAGVVSHDTPAIFLNAERQVRKIKAITSLDELGGFESEARNRGFLSEEIAAIHAQRIALTPKKRKRR
jgi:hypothetical protein